jgi:hypothetical protein
MPNGSIGGVACDAPYVATHRDYKERKALGRAMAQHRSDKLVTEGK